MEQVERLSRAGQRYESWVTNTADEFTGRMFEAINRMLLDTLAAVARKECDDRLRSQPSHHILACVTGEIIAVDWARRAVRIKWRTFRMSRPLVQIAFIAISMLSGVETARAASPNSAAIIADTKRGLVALECPKSSNGLLRVTALVYLPDNPSAPSYSRTYVLNLSRGQPISVSYSIDAGRSNSDVEMLHGNFSPDLEHINELRVGGKKVEATRDHKSAMHSMIETARSVAAEFCEGNAASPEAEAIMLQNKKNSGWPYYSRP